MDKKNLINLLLVASLCFGQLVANVHMAGHFHNESDGSGFTAFSHDSVDSFAHATHQHLTAHSAVDEHALGHQTTIYHLLVEHAGESNHSDNQINSDCAIYHAYLGQSGYPSSHAPGFAVAVRGINSTPANSAHVAILSLHNRPIRGPPSILLT